MNLKTYTFSLLILFLISCKKETKKETVNFDFIKTFEGKIDNKYPLHIKLNSENGKINGTYFYDKVGTDIEIKGTISKDSTLIINEFDQKGNQTGLWNGKLINENKISGTWSKPNGDSAKDFTLILTSDNYESSKKVISDSKYSNYNGTYNSPFNDGGISFGQLIIKYTENNEIEFDISTAHQAGCTGKLKGIAKINSNGIATHNSSNCKSLTFEFKNNEVTVKEKNCDEHGMRCFFSGTYKK
jgi:hypothetical protein